MLCSTFSFLHISIPSLWAGICNTKWVINKKQTHIRHTSSSHNQMHMQTFNPYITSPPTEDTTVKPHTSICAYTSFHWSRYNVNRIKLVTNRVAYWPLTHGCFCFFKKPSHLMMIILILLIFIYILILFRLYFHLRIRRFLIVMYLMYSYSAYKPIKFLL